MRNQNLTQYTAWRLWPVHAIAKLFGVLVHVNGFPFGSSRNVPQTLGVDGGIKRKAEGDPMLDPESIALLRASVANWIASGDLSQAHLLRSATREAADVISVLISAEQNPSEGESAPFSRPAATGRSA